MLRPLHDAPFLLRVTSVRVSVSVSVPDSDTLTDTVGQKWTRRRVKVDTPEGMSGHAGGHYGQVDYGQMKIVMSTNGTNRRIIRSPHPSRHNTAHPSHALGVVGDFSGTG